MTLSSPNPIVTIPFCNHDFPRGTARNGPGTLNVWPEELLWAAATVGRANYMDVLAHGRYSEYELIYRISIVLANLQRATGNRLIKSPTFVHLDPSEKGAISYYLGLSMCKLFAWEQLSVPWMLHFDVYRHLLGGIVMNSRQKPDLIGMRSHREWVVLESKGRTNGFTADLLAAGKQQTRSIRSIGGRTVTSRLAAVTHFTKGILTFDWADPEEYDEDAVELSISVNDFLEQYYKLVYTVLNNNSRQTFESEGYRLYRFEHFGFTIGLRRDIFAAYSTQNLSKIEGGRALKNQRIPDVQEQAFYFGADGIAVGIDATVRARLKGEEDNNYNNIDD